MKPRQVYRAYLEANGAGEVKGIVRVEQDWEGINQVTFVDKDDHERIHHVCAQTMLVWMFRNLKFERRER